MAEARHEKSVGCGKKSTVGDGGCEDVWLLCDVDWCGWWPEVCTGVGAADYAEPGCIWTCSRYV